MNSENATLRSQLEKFGDPRETWGWETGEVDYIAQLAATAADVPELVTVASQWADPIDWPDEKSYVAGYAPIHAWRCLAQLRAEQAIHPLLNLMDQLDEGGDDWYLSEFPHVFAWIGRATLEPLRDFLANDEHEVFARVASAHALKELAERHPEMRDDVLKGLCDTLSQFQDTNETVNAFIISYLLDMQAVEAAELIERAHAANCVDISVNGNWNTVRRELGIDGLGLVPEALAQCRAFSVISPPGNDLADDISEIRTRRDDHATIRSGDKVGRNAPCPCGSGKKYKKCCGR
ncbi:MAG: DUF1186 domain-containing protein [Phycisphaerae bacterium]